MKHKTVFGWPDEHWEEQDFKPYVKSQMQSIPTAYAAEPWVYPQGTSTKEILRRWKGAQLIMSATNGTKRHFWTPPSGILTVFVGPNFYNLSSSSQHGLAQTVAQLFGGRQYIMMDSITGKTVGTYTSQGLQMY